MELTRKQAIERLVMMKSYAIGKDYEALEYAISSLKTDEAYQIMYEGGEIFTKTDMVAMLTELQLEIEELDLNDSVPDYQKGAEETREYILDLIQQKIDALKEVVEDGK